MYEVKFVLLIFLQYYYHYVAKGLTVTSYNNFTENEHENERAEMTNDRSSRC